MSTSNEKKDWSVFNQLLVVLKPQIESSQHFYRGEKWYVLRDKSKRKHIRINARAYKIISLLDGKLTILDIFQALEKQGFEIEEVVDTVQHLFSVNFLTNAGSLVSQQKAFKLLHSHLVTKHQSRAFNPLMIKLPLINPNEFLSNTLEYVKPFFSNIFVCFSGCVIFYAILQTTINLDNIAIAMNSDLIKPSNLTLMFAIYVVMKLVHELSHAYTLRNWGGEVREMGVSFLVLMPIPYVEASDAWFISSKKKRIIISSIGIAAEVFIASVALLVWVSVGPGIISDIAFNTMLIGSLSTILFNANPLLKFDGYYILQDWLEIPNLASRSNQYWKGLIKHYFCGLPKDKSIEVNNSSRFWLRVYAPCAFVYRMLLLVTITLLLTKQYLFIGVMLACWAVFMQVILPLKKIADFIFFDEKLKEKRKQVIVKSLTLITSIIYILFLVPAPLNSSTQGVLSVTGKSEIVQNQNGFLEKIYVNSGDHVNEGTELMRFRNAELETELTVKQAQLEELQARLKGTKLEQRILYRKTNRAIDALEYELAQLQTRVENLTVKSQSAGIFYKADLQILEGQYVPRGQLIGYLRSSDNLVIRAVVDQQSLALIEKGVKQIEFRLAEAPEHIFTASISHESIKSSTNLPSAALGAMGGGRIVVTQEGEGIVANEGYFSIELKTEQSLGHYGLGGRAYIKFNYGSEPLAPQWWRIGTQLITGRIKT